MIVWKGEGRIILSAIAIPPINYQKVGRPKEKCPRKKLNQIDSIKLFQQCDIPKLPISASFSAVVAVHGRPLARLTAIFHFLSQ
jgi:hypothetical protein